MNSVSLFSVALKISWKKWPILSEMLRFDKYWLLETFLKTVSLFSQTD